METHNAILTAIPAPQGGLQRIEESKSMLKSINELFKPVISPASRGAALLRQRVRIPIGGREADFFTFHGLLDGREHLALGLGDWERNPVPLVRMHSECLTGDVFGSGKCDCGEQLNEAIAEIAKVGGLLLYLRQEGRGIGLYNKLDAYALQAQGYDTYQANRLLGLKDDLRDYTVAKQMLDVLGISRIKLLSNNPDKAAQLMELGIQIVEQVSTGVFLKEGNHRYLEAKVEVTRHKIKLEHFKKRVAHA
jgi:GTP cyclohydrolase II